MGGSKRRLPSEEAGTSGDELYEAVVWLRARARAARAQRRGGRRLFEHLFEEAMAGGAPRR